MVFPTVLLVLVHGPLQHCFRGRLASRTISVSAEWITTSVWSRMCLPVIGNPSLVNLNVLNYDGGDFPGIQRVFTCITCIRLLVHEPFLSITKPAWLIILVRRFKPLSSRYTRSPYHGAVRCSWKMLISFKWWLPPDDGTMRRLFQIRHAQCV